MHDHTHSEIMCIIESQYLRGTCCYHSALLVHTDAGDVVLVGINQNLSSRFLWWYSGNQILYNKRAVITLHPSVNTALASAHHDLYGAFLRAREGHQLTVHTRTHLTQTCRQTSPNSKCGILGFIYISMLFKYITSFFLKTNQQCVNTCPINTSPYICTCICMHAHILAHKTYCTCNNSEPYDTYMYNVVCIKKK